MGTFVQEISYTAFGDEHDPVTLAFPSNLSADDSIWVACTIHQDETPTISDSRGNSYTLIGRDWNAGESIGVCHWYATNASAGACTISIDSAAASGFRKAYANTASGIATASPVDGNNQVAQNFPDTSSDGVSSGTFTPTTDNCMIRAVFFPSSAVSVSAGTGFTSRQFADRVFAEDKNLTPAGSTAGTWTIGSSTIGAAAAAAFKPAGGGGGTTILPHIMQQYYG